MCSVRLKKNAIQSYNLFLLPFRTSNYYIIVTKLQVRNLNKTTNYLKKEIQLIVITFIYINSKCYNLNR